MQLHERKRSELSLSDEWELPRPDFIRTCEENDMYPILDICATKDNTKCPFFMTKEINALENDWVIDNSMSKENYPIPVDYARYINPPNRLTQKFIKKSQEQYEKLNIDIMMVIPINSIVTGAGVDCIWNDDNVQIKPVLPTPRFIHFGKQMESARNRYCSVTWRRRNEM